MQRIGRGAGDGVKARLLWQGRGEVPLPGCPLAMGPRSTRTPQWSSLNEPPDVVVLDHVLRQAAGLLDGGNQPVFPTPSWYRVPSTECSGAAVLPKKLRACTARELSADAQMQSGKWAERPCFSVRHVSLGGAQETGCMGVGVRTRVGACACVWARVVPLRA